MRTSVTLALAGLVACGNPNTTKQPPQDTSTKPAVTDQEPPPGDGNGAKQPEPPTEETKRERAEKALTRIPAVKEKLAVMRGLAFKSDVPAEYQEQAAFQTFVEAEVNKAITPEKATAIASSMHHIGLLTAEIDLAKTLSDAIVSQAAAYYDPKQKKFFVVMAPKTDAELDAISIHELTHALQDQHFDLDAYLEPNGQMLEDDVSTARKFVVEGEATFTMMIDGAAAMGLEDPLGKGLGALKMGLGFAANMTVDDFKKQIKDSKAGMPLDEEMQKAIDGMDTIPPVILVPMIDSYIKGALAITGVFEQGGWKAVGELYANPPDSTEQMLHADKLYPKRDVPKKITLAAVTGSTEVYGNTIGELEWRIYFNLWNKAGADKSADGWDGDRWKVIKTKDGALVGLVATTWDSAAEAKEFAAAYEKTVAVRFPNKERQVWVKTKGSHVFIVDGGTDAKLIDKLAKGTKIK